MTTNNRLFDPAKVAEAVGLFVGTGSVAELRALEAKSKRDRWTHTASGYFDDPQKLAKALDDIRSAKGIYITLNPVNRALLARAQNRLRKAPKGESTTDHDVVARRWLPIDCDPVRPSGISSSGEEHEAALQRVRDISRYLKALGFPPPIAADSGNGAHLLYRIDLPADDGGLVQRCLDSLADRFTDGKVTIDTGVFNPARIWKLYGTLACKGDHTVERPHRMAHILHRPEHLEAVPVGLLQSLAGQSCTGGPQASKATESSGSVFDLEAFVSQHLPDAHGPEPWEGIGQRWVLNTNPLCQHHDGAAWIGRRADGTIQAGCLHNSCSWKWPNLRAAYDPPVSQKQTVPRTEPVEAFRPFPTDVLPEPVRTFVERSAAAIGCDPAFIALPVLSVLAGVIGNTRRIQLKRSWSEPAVIWTSIIGESGTYKTPAFQQAIREVGGLQDHLFKLHDERLAQHQRELSEFEAADRKWKNSPSGDPPKEPPVPRAGRVMVDDTTIEALAEIIRNNPRGVLCACDELDGWLSGFSQYKGGRGSDVAKWLSMHSAVRLMVDRKHGEPILIPRACVSITGGIQPWTLRRALGSRHIENGLCARFLFAMPPRRPRRFTSADTEPAIEAEFASLLDRLRELRGEQSNEGMEEPVCLKLNRQAHAAWVQFYDRHALEQAELSGPLAAAFSKLEAYAARFALVFHLVRQAVCVPTLTEPALIDVDSIEAGITLADWFGHEARRLNATLGESDEDRETRRLLEWIEVKGGAVTTRDLHRSLRRYSTAEDAESALNELHKAGLGQWEMSPAGEKGGRATRRLRVC